MCLQQHLFLRWLQREGGNTASSLQETTYTGVGKSDSIIKLCASLSCYTRCLSFTVIPLEAPFCGCNALLLDQGSLFLNRTSLHYISSARLPLLSSSPEGPSLPYKIHSCSFKDSLWFYPFLNLKFHSWKWIPNGTLVLAFDFHSLFLTHGKFLKTKSNNLESFSPLLKLDCGGNQSIRVGQSELELQQIFCLGFQPCKVQTITISEYVAFKNTELIGLQSHGSAC